MKLHYEYISIMYTTIHFMLKAFETNVSNTLEAMENEGLINPHVDDGDYDHLADMVRERIGNFHEWKASKRHLRGVGAGVKDIEIRMENDLPRGNTLQGAFRLVSNPVDAARLIREQFGDIATYNQYRSIQMALAKSGLNHTDEVRSILMEHFPSDDHLSTIEAHLFHNDNWTPID